MSATTLYLEIISASISMEVMWWYFFIFKKQANNSQFGKLKKNSEGITRFDLFQTFFWRWDNFWKTPCTGYRPWVTLHMSPKKSQKIKSKKAFKEDVKVIKTCCMLLNSIYWFAFKRRCECFRPNSVNSNWLFSRYSIGWKCGLHADWTELRECVDEYLNSKEGTR